MLKNPQKDNDEISLNELMQIVWEGKWKIAVAVIISLIAVISYQSTKTKSFTAITEIKPLSSLELNKFIVLNNTIKLTGTDSNFKEITESHLSNLYIDILNNKSVFQDAMHKLNFLDASQYSDEQKYNEAINKLASSVKILTPLINNEEEGNFEISYHTINFIYDDFKKWKSVLIYANELVNQTVKQKLLEDYSNTLLFLKQKQEYQLEKLKTLMTNAQMDFDKEIKKFEMNREFQLQDIKIKIDNILKDYDRKIFNKLAFLREQAAIARKLGIAKNTIEIQSFGINSVLTNIKTDTAFYLRGYEAIEEEIELIGLRDNKQAFVDGLLELGIEKRILEQDKTLLRVEKNKIFLDTLIELEKKKRTIEQDKTIERIELAFQSTPLANKNEFSAAEVKILATKFEYKDNKILVIAIVIGLIVGVFYVLIFNAFQTQRVSRKKAN